MAGFAVGDVVRVDLPKGTNKRGVVGISVLYTTSPEARFDGATGDVTEINPRGPYGVPLYLVNFRGHDNRVAIPWQAQWFREEWIRPAGAPRSEPVKPRPQPTGTPASAPEGFAATEGWGRSTEGESS